MTRQEKVKAFFEKHQFIARWCTASVCACMGCVNNYTKKKEWYAMFPNDFYLTKEDIDNYNKQ